MRRDCEKRKYMELSKDIPVIFTWDNGCWFASGDIKQFYIFCLELFISRQLLTHINYLPCRIKRVGSTICCISLFLPFILSIRICTTLCASNRLSAPIVAKGIGILKLD